MDRATSLGELAAGAALVFLLAGTPMTGQPVTPFRERAQSKDKSAAGQKTNQGISASSVAGNLPPAPSETPEQLLEAQRIARQVPEGAKEGILASIKASNLPTADDLPGGFHEESGVGGEAASGEWINSPGKSGPYSNPALNRFANMVERPADQHLRDTIAKPQVFWHVHPAGTVRVGHFTYFWQQGPSDVDRAAAAPGAINIVVGARDETIYFYDREGPILTINLEDFLMMHPGA